MRAIVVMRRRPRAPEALWRFGLYLESGSIPLLVYATWNHYIEKAKINNMQDHRRGIQSSLHRELRPP